MEITYTWKKKFSEKDFNIFSNNEKVGRLSQYTGSCVSSAELYNQAYTFKLSGFFKQKVLIYNGPNQPVGEITFSFWLTNININIQNSNYRFKNKLWSNSKFSIFNGPTSIVEYAGNMSKGAINTATDNHCLILAGLYMAQFSWRTLQIAIFAALVPVLITSILHHI